MIHLILYDILGNTGATSPMSTVTSGTSQPGLTSVSTVTAQSGASTSPVATSSIGSTVQSSGSTLTSSTGISTTTKRCQEMQAVNEAISKQITVTPTDIPKEEKPEFQPTSTIGVSFPTNELQPVITVHFGKPARVQSVTIPRDTTPGANVEQFEVTLYSPNGDKINDQPIPSSSSPIDNKNKPAHVGYTQIPSNTPVSRVEIFIVHTTDDKSPKGVVLDIKACTEITTG